VRIVSRGQLDYVPALDVLRGIAVAAVVSDLPEQHPELVTSVRPAEPFEQRVGLPLERYLAIFFAVMPASRRGTRSLTPGC